MLSKSEVLPKSVMYPDDPIYNKLSQDQINEIYWQKYKIAKKIKPKIIIEIGVRSGYSAYSFLQAVPKAVYFGFDSCDERQAGGLRYIDHAQSILKPYKTVIFLKDTSTLSTLKFRSVDLVSVDGNHTYSYAYHDLRLAYESVRDGGYILVDDTSYIKSVKHAVDDFLLEFNQVSVEETVTGVRGYMLLEVKK